MNEAELIRRDIGAPAYSAGCEGAPPPLHVHPNTLGASWFPAVRETYRQVPPGPVMLYGPIVAPVGDDPTDPASQERRHVPYMGMMPRFNIGPRMERYVPVKP